MRDTNYGLTYETCEILEEKYNVEHTPVTCQHTCRWYQLNTLRDEIRRQDTCDVFSKIRYF